MLFKAVPFEEVVPGDRVKYQGGVHTVSEVFPRRDGSACFIMFRGGITGLFEGKVEVVDEPGTQRFVDDHS
jgi:hypothetical protein